MVYIIARKHPTHQQATIPNITNSTTIFSTENADMNIISPKKYFLIILMTSNELAFR